MAGLTDTGLTIESIETLLASIVADQLANIDANLNTEADSVAGQLNAIYAAALLECWELIEEVWQAGHADTASGQALSYIAALTGTIREPATRGTHTARFFGADTTPVPAGTEYYVKGRPDTSLFRTTVDGTVSGTYVDIATEAVEPGAHVYVLTGDGENLQMPNPPASITSVETVAYGDSTLGQDEENDSELRIRREAELGRPGSATAEAIRADLLEVTGVDKAYVYENVTSVTDAAGLPPHSIECLVYSENAPAYTAQDVVDAIWTAKPAGTATYGSLSGTATDTAGGTHTIYYSEPADVRVYVRVELTYDPATYVGDAAVDAEIEKWALYNLSMGDDVVASDIVELVNGLAGVVSVDGSNTGADLSAPASGNPSVTIALRQVASIDLADINVVSTSI